MKKGLRPNFLILFIALFFSAGPAFAFYWGVVGDYENKYQTKYVMHKIIAKDSIKYFLNEVESLCNMQFDQTLIDKAKEKAKYFKILTDLYKKEQ